MNVRFDKRDEGLELKVMFDINDIQKMIDTFLPKTDIALRRHARWISNDYDFICSLCRNENSDDSDYCPHCGAIMDL